MTCCYNTLRYAYENLTAECINIRSCTIFIHVATDVCKRHSTSKQPKFGLTNLKDGGCHTPSKLRCLPAVSGTFHQTQLSSPVLNHLQWLSRAIYSYLCISPRSMKSVRVNCVIPSANVGDVSRIEPCVPKTLTFVWTNVGDTTRSIYFFYSLADDIRSQGGGGLPFQFYDLWSPSA